MFQAQHKPWLRVHFVVTHEILTADESVQTQATSWILCVSHVVPSICVSAVRARVSMTVCQHAERSQHPQGLSTDGCYRVVGHKRQHVICPQPVIVHTNPLPRIPHYLAPAPRALQVILRSLANRIRGPVTYQLNKLWCLILFTPLLSSSVHPFFFFSSLPKLNTAPCIWIIHWVFRKCDSDVVLRE